MATLVAAPSDITDPTETLGHTDLLKSRDAYNGLLDDAQQPPLSDNHIERDHVGAVDLSTVHGHIFVVTGDGFIAYEYQDGPMPDLSRISKEFFRGFADYLVTNGLTNLLGLQVLIKKMDQTMWELILDQGTVMLDAAVARRSSPTRTSGWRLEARDGQPRVCASNEVHSRVTSGNHRDFNAGKPLPKIADVHELKRSLTDVGIL